jgi:VWFA-related protein
MRRIGFVGGCALLAAGLSAYQRPDEVRISAHVYTPPPLHLAVQTQLVQLDAVVRDSRGHPIAGLTQGDFEILDEGKLRQIAAFSVESRPSASTAATVPVAPSLTGATNATAPVHASASPSRFVLLFFDDLHANTGELRRVQNSAGYFVRHSLDANTRAAVFAASEGLTLDFTADADKLAAAIGKLGSHVRVSESGIMPCPRISPYQAYVIFNNIDPSAMVAAVSEAAACNSADTTIANPYAKSGARAGTLSKLPAANDQLSIVVQQQVGQTWEMVRAASLQSYDALAAAIARLAATQGMHVLLLASDGFLSGPEEAGRQQDLIDDAVRSGIVINGLDAKGLWSEPPVRPFNEVSEAITQPIQTYQFEAASIGARNSTLNSTISELASATGGLFFHNNNDLAAGFEQLGAVPETSYLMAFHPDPQDAAGKYHKLKVRLIAGRTGYVQTRPGYFAPSAGPSETEAARRKFDQEAAAADTLTDFPVQLAGRMGKTDKGEPQLSLIIHVDLAKLQFAERDGRYLQKLRFVGALMNEQGEMVAAKEGSMDLALTEETITRLTASGVNATLGLSARPGPYRVRVVVQDSNGRMATLSQRVSLPK